MFVERVAPKPGEKFFDLGSGTGRAVMAAALLYGHVFSSCEGMEVAVHTNQTMNTTVSAS